MLAVIFWTILFSLATVISITLTGSRALISGDFTLLRTIKMILDWNFIVGASFAFLARLFFILVNNSLLKIPHLAQSSTSITMFITSVALIFVLIANYYFLGERINLTQGIGAFIILFGIFIITR
ncbi:MAG: hypothetical protein AUK58_03115 [Candidatus Moranbacteria bacterium CG2_30_41_165]|nr:MAG: hypothetical protein AUK58_03115 [Candidatus Moranbacteria bacterium CG2_30_41_165]